MARLPQTKAEVFYSYEIQIDGLVVGTLQSFSPTHERSTEIVREVSTNNGEIVEICPGVPTYSATLSKVRLYEDSLLDAFGILEWDIQKQVQAIDIVETVYKPDTNVTNADVRGPAPQNEGTGHKIIAYEGCWITNWGKTVSKDNITIVEEITVQVTRPTV